MQRNAVAKIAKDCIDRAAAAGQPPGQPSHPAAWVPGALCPGPTGQAAPKALPTKQGPGVAPA